jgi:predicted O-methyltransferase YrrM
MTEAGFINSPAINRLRHSRAANRIRMVASLGRLLRRRDGAARALAAALRTTMIGRIPSEERAWSARIEAHRTELASAAEGSPTLYYPGKEADPGKEAALGGITGLDRRSASSEFALISLPRHWCVLLMRIVRELAPRSCVELGTGLGISAAYQAAALELNGSGTLTTLDAAPECTRRAKAGLSALGLDHRVELELGVIGETLEGVLERAAPVEYVFLDAEHQGTATLEYFETMLPYLSGGAVVVFDDVGFTADMLAAWKSIRRDERVSPAFGLGRVALAMTAAGGSIEDA